MKTTTKLEELRSRLVGRNVGGTTIVNARPELSATLEGEDLTRVWLLLTPPSGEIWDLDVVDALSQMVEEQAQELELPGSSVRLAAEGDEDLDDLVPERDQQRDRT